MWNNHSSKFAVKLLPQRIHGRRRGSVYAVLGCSRTEVRCWRDVVYINDWGSTSTMMLVRGISSAIALAISARSVPFSFSRLGDFRMK